MRTALATGDMGFLHSFTTGSTVDGPGVRVVAWTTGCQFRCLYCHNPDTWTMTNGIPVTLRAERRKNCSKYRHGLKTMSGGFTLSGGEPLMQDRFAVKLLTAAQAMGFIRRWIPTAVWAIASPMRELDTIDLVLLDIKSWDPEAPPPGLPGWRSGRYWISRAVWPPEGDRFGCASCWCPGPDRRP